MPSEMSERERISAAIAATRGMSEVEVQRAIFEAMRVERNRWAAFTDDELKMHVSALAALKGEWRINLLQDAAREIEAELERRRSDG